ncbi:unnamed protein product [Urochloa humidicola]
MEEEGVAAPTPVAPTPSRPPPARPTVGAASRSGRRSTGSAHLATGFGARPTAIDARRRRRLVTSRRGCRTRFAARRRRGKTQPLSCAQTASHAPHPQPPPRPSAASPRPPVSSPRETPRPPSGEGLAAAFLGGSHGLSSIPSGSGKAEEGGGGGWRRRQGWPPLGSPARGATERNSLFMIN